MYLPETPQKYSNIQLSGGRWQPEDDIWVSVDELANDQSFEIDIILDDSGIPKMDGDGLKMTLRKACTANSDNPICANRHSSISESETYYVDITPEVIEESGVELNIQVMADYPELPFPACTENCRRYVEATSSGRAGRNADERQVYTSFATFDSSSSFVFSPTASPTEPTNILSQEPNKNLSMVVGGLIGVAVVVVAAVMLKARSLKQNSNTIEKPLLQL